MQVNGFKVILCDADILLHRACVAASSKMDLGDGELLWRIDVREGVRWIRQQCKELRQRLGAEDIVMAVGDRKANFRKDLSPAYKASRRLMPKPPGFAELEAHLHKHAQVRREPRLEGDDILGLLATKEPTAGKVVASIDKDLLQIPGFHYNMDRDTVEHVDEEAGRARHLTQTLVGDRVDGYPGCPGVGPVRAAAILASGEGWPAVVAAFAKAGLDEEQALLQARLAFVLRQGYYDRKTKEVTQWTP